MTRRLPTRLVCGGCGAEADALEPFPFVCPNARLDDDVDHVLRRGLDAAALSWPGDGDDNPFVRFRTLLHAYHVARAGGLADEDVVALVRRLDDAVVRVEGRGFAVTPFARDEALSAYLGFSAEGGVWVKDETANVSGSHKARHLFGVLLWLEVMERLGRTRREERRDLAIASCGNAALASAVVAAAGGRVLRVFVPVDADPVVLARLEELGARLTVCERGSDSRGDPTVARLREALAAGALPFTCQGDLNGLAVEGGRTLGWELAASGVSLDHLVVQVGGGALASAVAGGLHDAEGLGAVERLPRLDTVQTEGAWPLRRAYAAILAHGPGGIEHAARHRSEFMWPWEQEPRSVAHGILDDETYDWLAVCEAMQETGGRALVVSEDVLRHANDAGAQTTGIDVDETGSAGLAGLLALRADGAVHDDERVALLFTGVRRSTKPQRKERTHEELPRAGHPVAEGLRAR